jgi:hypothetical protein
MRSVVIFLLSTLVLFGCATTMPAPVGSDSSLIVGELKVDVSGMGMAPDGAHGFVSTDQPSASALILRNETSGKDYEVRPVTSDSFFMLANAEPGHYRLMKLWAQVPTNDSYVTITSDFYKSVSFDVKPGRVANLGVNSWHFSYDLSHSTSDNSFVLGSDFPNVDNALRRVDVLSRWTGYQDEQAAFTGDVTARPSAEALPPRDSKNNQIWIMP